MHHWERADQYYTYNLSPFFTPEETAEDIESRRKFLEFHYALGGLLMYRELHAAIRRFFQFTRSQPPRYELLPDTMDEIFQLYFKFRDPYDRHYVEFVSMYYFPDVEGVNSEYIIKNWICKYLALLFIRQYSIVPYLITMKPLEQPRLPETQQKRKMWIDNVEYFRTLVESTYQNQELLEKYKFGYINDDWCRENNKPTPKEFFDKLIQNLNELYEKAEVEQTIADEKRDEFINYSRDKIISTIDLYKPISNKDEINDDFKEFFITGQSIILDKSAFALNQAADHLNYHSFLADGVSEKYRSGISEVFFYQATKRYLLKKQHLPKGIEQLNINGKDYKIIAFGINNEYLKNLLPEYNEESKTYHNISIYSYPQCNFRLVRESLFVLRNEDLPRIDNIDVKQDEKEKYDLGILDEDRKLYASLLDLNRYNALREEIEKERPNEDMRRSVLAMIAFVSRIRWKKKMNMVSIRVYSEFREKGLPIDPKDIVAI